MKYILQGIYDYAKDCYHDSLIKDAERIGCVLYDTCTKKKNNSMHIVATAWKEGNVWHYIKQRKIGNKIKKQRKRK